MCNYVSLGYVSCRAIWKHIIFSILSRWSNRPTDYAEIFCWFNHQIKVTGCGTGWFLISPLKWVSVGMCMPWWQCRMRAVRKLVPFLNPLEPRWYGCIPIIFPIAVPIYFLTYSIKVYTWLSPIKRPIGGLPHQTPIVYCEGPVHRSEKEIITWRFRKTHKDPRLETHQKSASVLLQLALCSRVLGPLVALLPFWYNIVIIKRGMRGRSFKFTCKRGKNGRHHRRPQKRGYLGEVVSSTLKTDKMVFHLPAPLALSWFGIGT
jgi:hypothetical protein